LDLERLDKLDPVTVALECNKQHQQTGSAQRLNHVSTYIHFARESFMNISYFMTNVYLPPSQ